MRDEGRRILLLCGAALVMMVGLTAYAVRSFSAPPKEAPPEVVALSTEKAEEGRPFLVYITGAVRNPGVYEMPRGSHLYDVVKAAGGELPYADLEDINLADPLTDNLKLHIPLNPEKADAAARGLVNVNTADEKTLESLPGIGEVTAQRIIEYREENGFFQTKEDLTKVKSISRNKLAKFADQITL